MLMIVTAWWPFDARDGLLLQEDLEEFEVKEGIKLAEAEAAHGSEANTVSDLVAAAVDNTLTQTFSGVL